ncbi:MAG TPA: CDP-diacylglycerol--serine O-phosphatidyltransferase [Elusimicrobia bacterium]|nr:CDP-diacylglycerol--serine O-phosphatidyltransferase [Elusimicrobiota bacterium]
MDKAKLKRSGQVLAPSLFTMGNMACGFFCLLACDINEYTTAATCILGGIAFDMLDGRVARFVHGESLFGVEFDSLADFLTFGVAPAYMMYGLFLKDYGIWGGIAAFLYVLGGSLRLARFNAVAQTGQGSKTHFTGLPIPAPAGLLASYVLLYEIVEQGRPVRTFGPLMREIPALAALGPFLVVGLGLLMVSTIPYAAFKQKHLAEGRNLKLVAAVVAALVLMYFYPQNTLFVLALFYVISGLMGLVIRRPKPQAPQAPDP